MIAKYLSSITPNFLLQTLKHRLLLPLFLALFFSTQASGSSFSVGTGVINMVSGDFTGDGVNDLAVINTDIFLATNLNIFLNDGSGNFTPAPGSPFTLGFATAAFAVVGDFNNDGALDIAVVTNRSAPATPGLPEILIFLNNGTGTFTLQPSVQCNLPDVMGIVAGNFRGLMSGGLPVLDLAVVGGNTLFHSIAIFQNDGSANFTPSFPIIIPFDQQGPSRIAAGSLKDDIFDDVVVAYPTGNTIEVFLNNRTGDGSFAAGTFYNVGTYPTEIALADFNHDGFRDIAVANGVSNNVSILLNQGNGTFSAAVNYPVGFAPFSLTTGNFNGNGNNDIFVANEAESTVTLLSNDGQGNFTNSGKQIVGSAPVSITSGIFQTGALPTFAVGNFAGSNVTVQEPKIGTTLVLTQSSSTSKITDSVTFTATVTPTAASPNNPSGIVTFFDGSNVIGTGALSTTGGVTTATFTTTTLSVGTHTIKAVYLGDINFTGSNDSVTHTVQNTILPPTNLKGAQHSNKFLLQEELFNELTWNPPVLGFTPVAYRIFRDAGLTQLAGSVPANVHEFIDRNRKPGVTYTYFVVAVDAAGEQSKAVEVIVHPKH